MPLYEFYCEPCHTVFTFRSRQVDTVTVPACPRCGGALRREVSSFAHWVKGASGGGTDECGGAERADALLSRMDERVQALGDEDADPREAAAAMRAMAAEGGMSFTKEVREALARIEAGEDPEQISEAFREVFNTENPFADGAEEESGAGVSWLRRLKGPARDPKWYDLA